MSLNKRIRRLVPFNSNTLFNKDKNNIFIINRKISEIAAIDNVPSRIQKFAKFAKNMENS